MDALVAELRADTEVLAVILVGSLSYDVVWEKSDIDLVIVIADSRAGGSVSMLKNDIVVHAYLTPRREFQRTVGSAVQSSFFHSFLSRGKVLFTRDQTISEFFDEHRELGTRDRQVRLLTAVTWLLPGLTKAQKWIRVKRDYRYAFLWIMRMIDGLATIAVVEHGGNPSREVVQRALVVEPDFFRRVYTDFIDCDKSLESVSAVVDCIEEFLRCRVELLFGPVLDYLDEAGSARSASEINQYFKGQLNLDAVDMACEWLADEGFIHRLAISRRLTVKSRVDVQETAFYFERTAAQSAST